MNLASMQNDLYRRLKFNAAPDASVTTRLTAYINEAQHEVMSKKGFSLLRRNLLTVPCVANTPFMSIPQSVERIITIQDRSSNFTLSEVLIQDIRAIDPGLTATSTFPDKYVVLDYAAAVSQDPSGAASLWVKSDSSSDGSTITAYIEGTVTGNYYQKTSVALNGTTAVQLGALTTWLHVTKFYLSLTAGGQATATGNVTLMQSSGSGTELARISPGGDYARYVRLHLYPVPTQVNTYYVDCEMHIEDMANAGDEPYLPEDFHWILVSMALAKEYLYSSDPIRYGAELSRYSDGLGDLRLYLAKRSGVAPNNRTNRERISQLGSWFPAGS